MFYKLCRLGNTKKLFLHSKCHTDPIPFIYVCLLLLTFQSNKGITFNGCQMLIFLNLDRKNRITIQSVRYYDISCVKKCEISLKCLWLRVAASILYSSSINSSIFTVSSYKCICSVKTRVPKTETNIASKVARILIALLCFIYHT